MSDLITDVRELRRRWIGIYLNLSALRSTNPTKQRVIDDLKENLVQANEAVVSCLDTLEATID